MQAGRLRNKIDIEQLSAASPQQLNTGEPDESWSVYLNDIWASVEPLSGRELFAAQEFHSEVTVRIRIRYRSGVNNRMRVVFGTKYYDIKAVIDPEERHREFHLLCSEGVVDSGVLNG